MGLLFFGRLVLELHSFLRSLQAGASAIKVYLIFVLDWLLLDIAGELEMDHADVSTSI